MGDFYLNAEQTNCLSCPAWSFVNHSQFGNSGARKVDDCQCREFYDYDAGAQTCTLNCPANRYVDNPPTSCFLCPKDTYLENNQCTSCPIYSESPEGSVGNSSCTCIAGTWHNQASNKCEPCGIGFFCPGNGTRVNCQTANPTAAATCEITLSTLTAFSTELNQCACYTQGVILPRPDVL